MNKVCRWIAVCVLTVTFLVLSFAATAALDEAVRVPFYHTLAAMALLANAMALRFWVRTKRDASLPRRFMRLPDVLRALFKRAFSAGEWLKPARVGPDSIEPLAYNLTRQTASSQDVRSGMEKIHSVAWGFPNQTRKITANAGTGESGEQRIELVRRGV